MRNVIGRENLITCGRTNELAHAVRTECSCDSFMADRMGLDGTILHVHYLAVRKAMASVNKPVHSKITLTYSLTWQADRCTLPGEWLSRRGPFLAFAQVFSVLIVRQNGLLLKNSLRVLSIIDQLRAWAHRRSAYAQLSPLYPSVYPYVTHVINYSRPSPAFLYWKRRKAGRGLGTRLVEQSGQNKERKNNKMALSLPHTFVFSCLPRGFWVTMSHESTQRERLGT